jgi:hypothetical protein
MALSFAFDPSKGETPETVAQRRRTADALAARIFGRAPQNVGEGLNALGQAWIASTMRDEANDAQKAGQASAADAWKQFIMGGGGAPGAPATAPAPSTATPMGATSIPSGGIDPRLKDAISNVASVHPDVDPAYMTRLALVENGGKIEGGSPLSSAQGPFQFLRGTAQQYGLANPNDPTASADAAARFTLDNRAALTKALGREPTPGELYLAHQQGASGAIKLLQNPNAPVESVVGAPAARNNAATPGMTAGQFANRWTGKFNDIVQTVDPNQKNIIDAQADMPVGAPAAIAGAAPVAADDGGAALPPNAQEAQGRLPTAQAVQEASQPQPKRSGYSLQQLMQLSANPWLNEGQRAAVNLMLKQQMQEQDPLRQLQIRKLETDLATGKNPESVREYEYAKKNGYEGSFQDWIASKRAGAGEYSLTPVYGKDAQGNTVLIQPGKSGTAVQTKLPEGVTISSGVDKIDLGTQWGILDKRSGQIVGYQPKDLKGAESQKALGKAQGGMQATLPSDIHNGEMTIAQIDDLIKHPGLSAIVGPLDQFRPNWTMGSEGRDALARFNQLKGKAFLQAYSTLRGGGQITEVEGVKAENAMARMDRAQSEAEFATALKDFRDAVQVGMQKLREKAGVAPSTSTNPQSGPVTINGYKIEAVD